MIGDWDYLRISTRVVQGRRQTLILCWQYDSVTLPATLRVAEYAALQFNDRQAGFYEPIMAYARQFALEGPRP